MEAKNGSDTILGKQRKEDSGLEEFLYISFSEEQLQSYVYIYTREKRNRGKKLTNPVTN